MAGPTSDSATDLSVKPVPQDERVGKGSLSMAWWAVCSAMFYIIVGGTLALDYGTFNAIVGMLLSVLLYAVITAIMARHAILTGHSVTSFSVELFGKKGSLLAALILGATAIYYAVFEGSVIAVAISHLTPSISYTVAALIVVAYSVPMTLGKIQAWLDKLNGVLLPFYAFGLLAAIGMSVYKYGYAADWIHFGPAVPPAYGWWNCFVSYMGIWVLMLFAYEYAKFGKPADSDFHARWNFGLPFYFVTILVNGVCGIYLVSSVPDIGKITEVSVVLAILSLLGVWGLVFVWATQTRINSANFFVATGNVRILGQSLGLRLPYAGWVMIVGALVFMLMLADVFSYLLEALAYQGIIVVAWVGVAFARILAVRKDSELPGAVEAKPYNAAGLLAWSLASVTGFALMHVSGPLATLSAPATALVAYGVTYLSFKKSSALMAKAT